MAPIIVRHMSKQKGAPPSFNASRALNNKIEPLNHRSKEDEGESGIYVSSLFLVRRPGLSGKPALEKSNHRYLARFVR